MQKKIVYLIILLVYMPIVIVLLLNSAVGGFEIIKQYDTELHFLQFVVLAFLIYRTLSLFKFKWSLLVSFVLGSSLGVVTEYLQRYVPMRQSTIEDAVTNVAGVVIGILIGYLIKWRSQKR